ncbi:MAG TPA: serine/threonine-protein kinase [Bryobacteraceae bacterium]|nr:serine/threonine-protein kinase [Bryobacteraceae bacterium]
MPDSSDQEPQTGGEHSGLPVPGAGSTVTRASDSSGVRDVIGPYQLLQLIGEGGMGEVWLAEQKAPVRRRVALKLIKPGMDSREVVARFESERQALAVMDHPAIAKVFDAGTTPKGRPYFVMEYVAGIPVTAYCDKHKLAMRDRLQLFIQVCEGVQHAHQKAIIHRDLKPSNILVTEVDGKPAPKIIDFGVAKAISQRLTAETIFTQAGAVIGTPEYMSPEQADLATDDIDTRSDVYSLGVILYELLVGALPLDLKELRKLAFHELLRRLREDDVPRPSTKLRTLGERSGVAAQNRRTEPGTLTRQLRGDLDAITLKALEKNRSRRYGSPSDFATDIKRYLSNELVIATPPSIAYRTQKFVRRHRVGVAATATVASLLIVLAVSMTIQRIGIAHERDRANREAATAKSISDFLIGLFQISDPDEARGNQVTAREILDKGAREIQTGLSGQPDVQARMMATIANVYDGLGLYRPATKLFKQALDLRRRVLGPGHRDTLVTQRMLARVEQREGHYADAERLFAATLAVQKRVLGSENSDTLDTASALGGLYFQQGRYADSEKTLSAILPVSRRTRGPDDPATLTVVHNLALAYDGLRQYSREEELWRELAAARRRVLGPDHPSTLASLQNLAYVNYRQGKLAQAEKLQREVLETARRVQGPTHPDVLLMMGNLANTLENEGHLVEAEKLHRAVLEQRLHVLGPDNPDTLFGMNNLADVLTAQAKYVEAERLYRQALDGERRVLGENHPEVSAVSYNLSRLEALRGNRAKAFGYLRQALDQGYSTPEELTGDDAWKPLRADPEYEALLAQVRQRAGGIGKAK